MPLDLAEEKHRMEIYRLIIGCDKTTSYGMVAASNMSRERINYLKFRTVLDQRSSFSTTMLSTATPHYRWEYSGLAESRVGPDPIEVEQLRAGRHLKCQC